MKNIKIEYADVNNFVPNKWNPNVQTDFTKEKTRNSIKEFGFVDPVTVRETEKENVYEILDGEHRWIEAKGLDIKEIPFVSLGKVDDVIAKQLTIVLNEIKGFFEEEKLSELLNELNEEIDYDKLLKDLPYTGDRLDELLEGLEVSQKDEGNFDIEKEVEPITQTGDIWLCGKHRIMCGDSTKAEDVEKLMDGGEAVMVFADPPYGVGFEYSSYDDIGGEEYEGFLRKWFKILKLRSDFVIITCGHKNKRLWYKIDDSLNEMIWYKKFGNSPGFISYTMVVEPILVYGKCPRERYDTDFFEFMTDREDGLGKLHPCPKPIGLLEALIKPQTKRDGIILDIFLGSGTTLIVSERTGRICYGMEISPDYCDVIVNRYINYVESSDNIYLLRDNNKISYSEI